MLHGCVRVQYLYSSFEKNSKNLNHLKLFLNKRRICLLKSGPTGTIWEMFVWIHPLYNFLNVVFLTNGRGDKNVD